MQSRSAWWLLIEPQILLRTDARRPLEVLQSAERDHNPRGSHFGNIVADPGQKLIRVALRCVVGEEKTLVLRKRQ